MSKIGLALVIAALPTAASAQAPALAVDQAATLRVPVGAVASVVGRRATVCGEAMDLGCHGADRLAALMFSTGPGEPAVSIRVPAGDRDAVVLLAGAQRHPRPVCATGEIEAAVGTFRVTARRRDDVTFEGAAATDRRLRRSCEPGLGLPTVRQDVRTQ